MPAKTQLLRLMLPALPALLCAGCVGYSWGTTLPPHIRDVPVHVPTCVNKSSEPLIEVEVTRALIEEIQKDGSLTIGADDPKNSRIEVDVTDYSLEPVAYRRGEGDSTSTARDYRMVLTASYRFYVGTNQDVYAKGKAKGDSTFPFTGDLATAKREALPDAARDLGRNVIEQIVEAW